MNQNIYRAYRFAMAAKELVKQAMEQMDAVKEGDLKYAMERNLLFSHTALNDLDVEFQARRGERRHGQA